MPRISLTDFVDFIIKSGSPKQTVVYTIMKRPPYNPSTDFWKVMRDGLQEYHKKENNHKDDLDIIVNNAPLKKQERYKSAIDGYRKFLGKKIISWFDPPKNNWIYNDLDIRVNPELGLMYDGKRYVIKLYFKDENPTKNRFPVVWSMMNYALRNKKTEDCIMAVLDVAKGKLFESPEKETILQPLLLGEAASFLLIWKELEKS